MSNQSIRCPKRSDRLLRRHPKMGWRHILSSAFVAVGLLATGCTEGFPFGPPPTLDSADWSIVDRGYEDFETIRLANLTSQTVLPFTFSGLDTADYRIDLSVSGTGLLAARSGETVAIIRLSDLSTLRSKVLAGQFVALSNADDRLAVVDVAYPATEAPAAPVATLQVFDVDLNPLMSRVLPFTFDPFDVPDFDISWSPDDSSIVVSTAQVRPAPPTKRYGLGAILSSTDPNAEHTGIPYATAYFVGDRELVGTRYSDGEGIFQSTSVVRFSLTSAGVEEGETIPNAYSVASSWPATGTFLVRERPPFLWIGSIYYELNQSLLRIRDTQARFSEILGFGPVEFDFGPTRLFPRPLAPKVD